jgi:hypothetical protein
MRHPILLCSALLLLASCSSNAPSGETITTGAITLSITTPVPDSSTESASIAVTGRATGTDKITVNGVATVVTTASGEQFYSATVPLDWGDNNLVVLATNASGDKTASVIIKRVDLTPPLLNTSIPAATDQTTVTVTGTATDLQGIASVTINGAGVTTTNGFANWTSIVPLVPGPNTLTVVATDLASLTTTTTLSIGRYNDSGPPVIADIYPSVGMVTDMPSAVVRVRVTDESVVTGVTLGGAPMTLGTDGYWRATVDLPDVATVTKAIVATDLFDRVANGSVDIKRISRFFGNIGAIAATPTNQEAVVYDESRNALLRVNVNNLSTGQPATITLEHVLDEGARVTSLTADDDVYLLTRDGRVGVEQRSRETFALQQTRIAVADSEHYGLDRTSLIGAGIVRLANDRTSIFKIDPSNTSVPTVNSAWTDTQRRNDFAWVRFVTDDLTDDLYVTSTSGGTLHTANHNFTVFDTHGAVINSIAAISASSDIVYLAGVQTGAVGVFGVNPATGAILNQHTDPTLISLRGIDILSGGATIVSQSGVEDIYRVSSGAGSSAAAVAPRFPSGQAGTPPLQQQGRGMELRNGDYFVIDEGSDEVIRYDGNNGYRYAVNVTGFTGTPQHFSMKSELSNSPWVYVNGSGDVYRVTGTASPAATERTCTTLCGARSDILYIDQDIGDFADEQVILCDPGGDRIVAQRLNVSTRTNVATLSDPGLICHLERHESDGFYFVDGPAIKHRKGDGTTITVSTDPASSAFPSRFITALRRGPVGTLFISVSNGSVYSVNTTTGQSTLVRLRNDAGVGFVATDIVWDEPRYRLMVLDGETGALYAVDPVGGHSYLFSR